MKKILVPTDFSACAKNAMNAGFAFAQKFNSSLHFLHVMDDPAYGVDAKEQAQKKHNIQLLFDEWVTKAKETDVDYHFHINTGKFIDQLQSSVHKINPDFIIIGSHGASGKKEIFIGSNTQKAIRAIHRPFFIVKEALVDITFEKVVFASSFNESEQEPFRYFLSLMEYFNPEIHLVAINTFNWFSQPYVVLKDAMDDYKRLAEGFYCKKHFFSDFNVEAGIRHFSDKIGADLIAVANVEKHPLKRIFSGSNVEALVNHSHLPLLSIDYPH